MTFTTGQLLIIGIVATMLLVVVIASLAIAINFILKGRKLKTPLGSIDSYSSCECSMASKIEEMYHMLSSLVETNTIQSSNIVMLCRVQRPIMSVLRYHSHALREAGANGSTEKAEESINNAESILNEGAINDTKSAMDIVRTI